MARKTHFAGAVTFVTALGFTFASAELSGANAQQGVESESPIQTPAPALTEETVPVFISEPVIQPLPVQESASEDQAEIAAPEASSLRELVRVTDTSADLSREMECLAGAIYFESRGEPLAGQLAVAKVIINRSEDRRFPSSYCGVVFQRSQFSFVKNGSMPRIKRSSAAWKRAKAISHIAHKELWESAAKDSLYFHAKYVRPSWSRKKTARTTIKTHIFYR